MYVEVVVNKLKWNTDTYHAIRKGFESSYNWYSPVGFYRTNFAEELEKHSGKIVRVRKLNSIEDEVVDMLGMNSNYEIQFANEQLYMMFLLRWS
jgi:hypothetical protein